VNPIMVAKVSGTVLSFAAFIVACGGVGCVGWWVGVEGVECVGVRNTNFGLTSVLRSGSENRRDCAWK